MLGKIFNLSRSAVEDAAVTMIIISGLVAGTELNALTIRAAAADKFHYDVMVSLKNNKLPQPPI